MFEVKMFIPVAGEDGMPFAAIDFIAFERQIVARFGGFKLAIAELSRCYTISVSSIVQGAKVYELALFAKALFVQDEILVEYLGHHEELS